MEPRTGVRGRGRRFVPGRGNHARFNGAADRSPRKALWRGHPIDRVLASMEPRTGVRGRDGQFDKLAPRRRASMEPRTGVRGRPMTERPPAFQFYPLQWSRGPESAEGYRDARPPRVGRDASMEPRTGVRGRPSPAGEGARETVRFNGAADRSPRKGPGVPPFRFPEKGFNGAADRSPRKVDGSVRFGASCFRLQWSRGPESAERRDPPPVDESSTVIGRASMEPRTGVRGR